MNLGQNALYAMHDGGGTLNVNVSEIDIDDVVYLIAYIFTGGPPPCGCMLFQ